MAPAAAADPESAAETGLRETGFRGLEKRVEDLDLKWVERGVGTP